MELYSSLHYPSKGTYLIAIEVIRSVAMAYTIVG